MILQKGTEYICDFSSDDSDEDLSITSTSSGWLTEWDVKTKHVSNGTSEPNTEATDASSKRASFCVGGARFEAVRGSCLGIGAGDNHTYQDSSVHVRKRYLREYADNTTVSDDSTSTGTGGKYLVLQNANHVPFLQPLYRKW